MGIRGPYPIHLKMNHGFENQLKKIRQYLLKRLETPHKGYVHAAFFTDPAKGF